MQQEDDMAIHRRQLYHMVGSQLLLNSIILYRQPVDYMAVFLDIYLAQDFIYNHHQLEAFRILVFSLTEYRHCTTQEWQSSYQVLAHGGK